MKNKETFQIGENRGGLRILVESKEAKQRVEADLVEMANMATHTKENNLTCGDCAAQPCFRNHGDDSPAGLCYQKELQCRQECDTFLKHEGSGKSPTFQITGVCKRDMSEVNYGQRCHFLD
jgi:hypothetical protein